MKGLEEKMVGTYPWFSSTDEICRNGLIKRYIRLLNWRKTDWSDVYVPYMKDVTDYLKKRGGEVGRRLLLVCENEMIAMMASTYIKDHCRDFRPDVIGFEFDWDDEFDLDEGEEDESLKNWVRVIRLDYPISRGISGLNPYVPYLSEVEPETTVFLCGLSGGCDMYEKTEAVEACPSLTQLIYVHPDQMKEPWVEKLIIEYGADVLRIQAPPAEHYEKVLDHFLEGEAYHLAEEVSPKLLIRKIIQKRGSSFKEEDLMMYLFKAAVHRHDQDPTDFELKMEDFEFLSLGEENPLDSLMKLSGLKHVKEIAEEIAALVHEEIRNKQLKGTHKHMLFVGNPGTGKTTCAEILANIMAEEGMSNAVLVKASRRDVIGEYVGRTAPMVAQLFDEARGGVLFVDEAGFFLNQNAGGYVDEALKEFVRYMEMYSDVTVIFAMYPGEAKRFLELDAGLSSRISRIVEFDDYSIEELCEITETMLRENGYTMKADAKSVIRAYMEHTKKEKRQSFGNAREARNLAESAVVAISMKHYQKKKRGNLITKEDMRAACARLKRKKQEENRTFGFLQETTLGLNMQTL